MASILIRGQGGSGPVARTGSGLRVRAPGPGHGPREDGRRFGGDQAGDGLPAAGVRLERDDEGRGLAQDPGETGRLPGVGGRKTGSWKAGGQETNSGAVKITSRPWW
ncbi:hypothetical protein GCM10010206_64100 [Streptomyces cinerochromogenes]|nr:hypothetical protein GCM10010206_64100 [Streptomyces cinerochromogenes]